MANITTAIPNLIQGVSQQSPTLRLAGQCEEQLNGLSTLTKGLAKRPPARLIENLGRNVYEEGDFVHFIERSATERYVVVMGHRQQALGKGKIRAFNLDTGVEASIEGVTGGYELSTNYLNLATPENAHKEIKALTLGDSTFLLNTNVTVGKLSDKSEKLDKTRALVFIKQGDFGKKYGLRFRSLGNETLSTTTGTPDGAILKVQWQQHYSQYDGQDQWHYSIRGVEILEEGTNYNIEDEPTVNFGDNVEWEVRPEFDITVGTYFQSGVPLTGVIKVKVLHAGQTKKFSTTQLGILPSSVPLSPPFYPVHIVTEKSSGNPDEQIADTSNIATELARAVRGYTRTQALVQESVTSQSVWNNYTVKDKSGSLLISRDDEEDFFLEAFDGLAGAGLGLVHKEVDALSDLPLRAPDGFRVAVRGDANENADDYYLRFETNDGQSFGEGGWLEDIGPDINTSLDADTLPVQLINNGLNTFTLSNAGWTDRKAGDDDTNPFPSFVGKRLNNFVFFKNRLGFIFEDSVVLSEAAELFNFFKTTVRTLLDTAPIDLTSATANVTNLRSSVTFQENLLLFADRGQFVLKGDPLTNETVSLEAITNYDVETTEDPLALGSYVYFPFKRGNFLGLQEYSLNATTSVYDSGDLTTQVPSYIKAGNILVTSGSSASDLMAVSTGGRTVYIYKYYFNGNEKIVSSWSKFTFPFDVISLEFMQSSLFVIGLKDGKALLSELKCEELRVEDDTTGGFTVHLDLLKKHTFDGAITTTPTDVDIPLGFSPEEGDVIEVYDDRGFRVNINYVSNDQVNIQSYNRTCFSGVQYKMEYTFSEPVFKQGNPPVTSGLARLALRNGTLFFTEAVDFQVEVTPLARDTQVYTFSPNIISSTTTDTLLSGDGSLRFSIFTQAKDSVIKIVNTSAFASNFQSCEFEANVHTRSTRI